MYPVTAAAYRRGLCAAVKLHCYGIIVSQPVGVDPNLFRESVLAELEKDFMRIHHTSVITVLATVNFVNVITCIGPPLWSSGQSFWLQDTEFSGSIPGTTRFSE